MQSWSNFATNCVIFICPSWLRNNSRENRNESSRTTKMRLSKWYLFTVYIGLINDIFQIINDKMFRRNEIHLSSGGNWRRKICSQRRASTYCSNVHSSALQKRAILQYIKYIFCLFLFPATVLFRKLTFLKLSDGISQIHRRHTARAENVDVNIEKIQFFRNIFQ